MNYSDGNIVNVGIAALLALSGVMALVFVNYIKNIIRKIDDVSHVGPLLKKVEELVSKVDRIFITLEVTREKTHLEVEALKERVQKLEALVERMEGRNHG